MDPESGDDSDYSDDSDVLLASEWGSKKLRSNQLPPTQHQSMRVNHIHPIISSLLPQTISLFLQHALLRPHLAVCFFFFDCLNYTPSCFCHLQDQLDVTTRKYGRIKVRFHVFYWKPGRQALIVLNRQELLAWLNNLLQLNVTKVEQCGTGYVCQKHSSHIRNIEE
jgi:hypothetical protein